MKQRFVIVFTIKKTVSFTIYQIICVMVHQYKQYNNIWWQLQTRPQNHLMFVSSKSVSYEQSWLSCWRRKSRIQYSLLSSCMAYKNYENHPKLLNISLVLDNVISQTLLHSPRWMCGWSHVKLCHMQAMKLVSATSILKALCKHFQFHTISHTVTEAIWACIFRS